MTTRVKDGATIATITDGDKTCAVCGEALGAERWWVIPGRYPLGEHERCRDWSTYAFPYERQLDELRKVFRRLEGKDGGGGAVVARLAVEVAGRELRALEGRWPVEALAVLDAGRIVVSRVKNELGAAGIDPKVFSQV